MSTMTPTPEAATILNPLCTSIGRLRWTLEDYRLGYPQASKP